VAKTSILLPPSLKPQNGSNKSLVIASVSSLSIIVGVENLFQLILALLFQSQRKP